MKWLMVTTARYAVLLVLMAPAGALLAEPSQQQAWGPAGGCESEEALGNGLKPSARYDSQPDRAVHG